MRLSVSVCRTILLLPAALVPVAAAQVQLEFAPPLLGQPATFRRVVQMANGNRLLVGSQNATASVGLYNPALPRQRIALVQVGLPPGTSQPYPQPAPGGSGNDIPYAAAVDPSGNIWIAGDTDSDDFTLVNPIVSQKIPYWTAGFVIELDPTGTQLLFATYLTGQQRATMPTSSHATAITTDAAGNVYVGGSTNQADFPTTPGAFLKGRGGYDVFYNSYVYSFLMKISPSGKLLYSTELGTGASACLGGSRCVNHASTSAGVSDLAVDAAGSVTVAGTAGGSYSLGTGYIMRVAPDASKLTWTAEIPSNGAVVTVSMAQDSAGNVNLFGQYVTMIDSGYVVPYKYFAGPPGLYAAKLKANGVDWIYQTDLGISPDVHAAGIALDASGNAYLAGTNSSPQFPTLAGVPALGADFALRLDAAGVKPQSLFRFPTGVVTAPPAFDSAGRLMLPGSHGALLHLPPAYAFDAPAIVAFGNSASYELNTGLAAGALASLFGFNLPASAQGLVVHAGNLPAPVLYAGSNQINFVVPFGIPSYQPQGTQLQVSFPAGSLVIEPPFTRSLGIFTSDGVHAAALNQDGSVNSAANPAAAGSVVTVFGTGAIWPSGVLDGGVATAALQLDDAANRFTAVDSAGTPLAILYAGAAPGLIYGVFQMNLRTPQVFSGTVTLQASDASAAPTLVSNAVQIYVK